MLRFFATLVRLISGLNLVVGHVFSWLAVGIVAVCFTVVVQRYVFSISYVWMQDLYVWLNGVMFMAVAGFSLLRNDHVRVDIFYRAASPERRAMVDLFGVVVFLLPFTWVVAAYGWEFVARSWRYGEGSVNPGGMPGLYVVKSFIVVFAVLLALQGLAIALRSILVLAGRSDLLPPAYQYQD